ncbi:D-alanyl-D-alanine carboxypeptidase family protein [Streptomyces sp. NPDC008313]|uniref:D-alanyl-D-alanine carboxypeptidase family protein n=1 Tax=Streptomyces sp. NPDC008313 TaxID=3364826 RepID=UPI0036E0E921
MTIGLSSRAAVSCSVLCVLGTLALAPASAATRTDAGPGTPQPAATSAAPDGPETQVRPHDGAPAVPEGVSARSWLVADADSGEVLAAHDAHRELPPASTLKTLFALTLLPKLPGGVRHTVTAGDLAGIGAGSSLVGVVEGESYRADDLWRGVFLKSGNDAVHVLAAMNGGWTVTAGEMQEKAHSLGARDTHVVSPDGYDAPGQVSSAYDLALFAREGLRNADFARYCATVDAEFPAAPGRTIRIQNTNRLLTGADGVARYPGLIGIKNGYTSGAGNTLMAAARRGDRTLVVTVLDPRSGGGHAVYEEARALLDWGFAASGHVDPVDSLTPPAPPAAQAGPPAARAASAAPAAGPVRGWRKAVWICGAGGLGAAAVALALRVKGRGQSITPDPSRPNSSSPTTTR